MRIAALALAALLLGAAEQAGPDALTSYCGGGVTGGGGGLRIAADGSLTRLRRPHAGAPAEEIPVEGRRGDAARLAAMLDAAGFERMPRGSPANMTCSLTRRRAGATHTVMWPIGSAPAALRPILQEIDALGR